MADYPCPKCSSKKPNWKQKQSYQRFLTSYENGRVLESVVTVSRYLCSSCNSSHALIPEILIPYSQYSILFIMKVLKDRYIKEMKINAICKKYKISQRQYYRWNKQFNDMKHQWESILIKVAKIYNKHDQKKNT